MARIRKFGNASTELRMLRLLRQHGIIGWRRHLSLPGRPDFAFPHERVVLFIDGCFWHRCPRCSQIPRSRRAYWLPKLLRNVERDREADRLLRKLGWKVLHVWEHSLEKQPIRVIARLLRLLGQAHISR
jgi:DNA mismatch endonuclease (patch repair protein)